MASDVTESVGFYKLWAWLETNRKQAAWGAVIAAVVVLGICFFVWQQGEAEVTAAEALSNAAMPQSSPDGRADSAKAYLSVAAKYPKSAAGARALLLGAGSLFVEGKYPEAQAQFERFAREHHDTPFMSQALLGIAACLDAQGKTNEAISAYKNLVEHHAGETVALQARFALARLYEAQGRTKDALDLFEEINRADPYGSIGSEAGIRAEELKMKYPSLTMTTPAPTNAAPFMLQNR